MKFIISIVLLIALTAPLTGYSNPFQKPAPQPAPAKQETGIKEYLAAKQLVLKQHMVKLSKDVKQGNWIQLWWLLGLAFGYGALHAAGPGHGKTLVASYLMAKGGSKRSGVFIGALTAFVHGSSAVIIALIIYWLSIGRMNHTFNQASNTLEWIGYSLITLIGLIIFVRSIKGMGHNHSHVPLNVRDKKRSAWVVLSLGMVPCPANMIVLMFFLSMNMMLLGILVTVTVAVGMALTVAAVGGLTIIFREYLLKTVGTRSHSHSKWGHYAETLGGTLVMLFGIMLLYTKF